jgi:cell division protein FtsB
VNLFKIPKIPLSPALKLVGLGIIFSGFLLYLFVFGEKGWLKSRELNRRIREIKSEIQKLEGKANQLKIEIWRAKHDPTYLEKLAREELGMAKEGEIIYKIID